MNGSNQRKYSRKKLEVELTFNVGGEKFSAQTVDLSEGGIGVILEKEIEPGTEVEIRFKNKADYTIHGTVKWATQISNGSGNYYRLGIDTGKTGTRILN